jgi:hypothetical protein
MQYNKVYKHNQIIEHKSHFTNNNGKANEIQLCVYKHMAYCFYSLDRDLNQDSNTRCSRYQLTQFPPHHYMFEW